MSVTTAPSIDLSITSGPGLAAFLGAALKGGGGNVEFEIKSSRLRGARITSTKTVVEITKAQCEDGNGMLFIIEGSLNGRKVKGFYNAKKDSSSFRTGFLNYC